MVYDGYAVLAKNIYGLCAVPATLQELSECLMKVYYEIHPQGGIRRTARRGTRQLAPGFYGIGCPHPAIECLIAQLNKLIMHFGSPSCLGINMQTSVELLVIKLGLSLQPFAEDYDTCQHWVTPSWLKSVWENHSNSVSISSWHTSPSSLRESTTLGSWRSSSARITTLIRCAS